MNQTYNIRLTNNTFTWLWWWLPRNVSHCHRQQSFSGLPSPGRSHYTIDHFSLLPDNVFLSIFTFSMSCTWTGEAHTSTSRLILPLQSLVHRPALTCEFYVRYTSLSNTNTNKYNGITTAFSLWFPVVPARTTKTLWIPIYPPTYPCQNNSTPLRMATEQFRCPKVLTSFNSLYI